MVIFGIITEPRRNCKSADDTPKYAQLVPLHHTDGGIPRVERHKLHAPRSALEPLAVSPRRYRGTRRSRRSGAFPGDAPRRSAREQSAAPCCPRQCARRSPRSAILHRRPRRCRNPSRRAARPYRRIPPAGRAARPHGAPLLRGRKRRDDIPDMIETAELHKLTGARQRCARAPTCSPPASAPGSPPR